VPKLNNLRQIVRDAQNRARRLTWSADSEQTQKANDLWDKLDDIFKWLGPFKEEE